MEDITLEPDYVEVSKNIRFPMDPEKEGYAFAGWFTEAEGGEKVTEYSGSGDITLYAQYITEKYNLGVNNIPKDDVTAVVTFKYNDDGQTADAAITIGKQYVPNGWLVDGVHYEDNAIIDRTKDTVIKPDYVQTVISGTWPSDPARYGYEFKGWTGSNGEIPQKDITIPKGTRCFQFRLIKRQPNIDFVQQDSLNDTNRGGFGSSGV